jgi:ABC-2 type transport system ATP-binding protein
VELPSESGDPTGPLPAGWLEFERSGRRVTFVDRAFEQEKTLRACLERFPGGTFAARPMTLREIFLTLARTHRAELEGATT